MKYEYNLIIKHPDNLELTFISVETDESTLENICTIIEQQQKLGKIPYHYNLINISVKVL